MRPSQVFHTLETLRNNSSVTFCRKGTELSLGDSLTVSDVYLQWLCLIYDLGYLHPSNLKRVAHRLWRDFSKADVYTLNQACAECLHSIRMQTPVGFKGHCGQISSHLFNLVKEDFSRCLSGDVESARRLIQLFSYTSRLSLNDIDLTQQLLDDYLDVEENILQQFPDNIVHALNKIIRAWFGAYTPDEIVPRHGPGGIAEHGRCSLEAKYKALATDGALQYAFGDSWWVHGIRRKQPRISRTIFVPKSYKTFRTISMEPATLQYFQQGVWRVIENWVESHQSLRSHIGFRDQTRNRRLAQLGSMYRNYATIDLSSASDSVSYELVKKLFRGTWLLRYLVVTRSRETLLPDGRIIKLKKFAPMGSSLCFPVETIIFASICEHVTRVDHVPGRYSVYGDDIIVPTQCVEKVMRFLEILGFRVNYDKSFYQDTCWFRESCGGEFCDGYDVTPMRVSRKYASREDDVRIAKLIDKANEAYTYGYRCLRYFYINKLQKTGYKLYFAPTNLVSDNYTNYHTRKRWNSRLQRIEVHVSNMTTIYNKREYSSQDESIRYRHWLETCYTRKNLCDGFESIVCRPMVTMRDTWLVKPYERHDQPFIDSHKPSR
ncbi:TPA_asm: RNA-directed RNA polymerase [ssRNA phage SRR5466725_5]|uniref:RNA-directed RNA polymerase n=1 Tax=ssRNA phage SRR5466725_5 TaxID=2786424 RepID=A0A8S5KZJ3_9VIRU|nr:RNA-directed RNA polymerase [ssRNA phage SRR5466725_5]DAD50817.1 TPA_asm: RNA-directed RNA polymerase [ssRNA phage SRR5466725_5]